MKKGMRLAAFLLAALLTLTVLAGCSAEESPSQADSKPGNIPENVEKIIAPGKYDFGGATVTIASPYPVDLENGSQESNRLKEHMAALEKNWNVKVKFELINADLYWTEMGTTVLGGGAFGDLCIGSTIYLPDWIGVTSALLQRKSASISPRPTGIRRHMKNTPTATRPMRLCAAFPP